jgi:hypothetical protein
MPVLTPEEINKLSSREKNELEAGEIEWQAIDKPILIEDRDAETRRAVANRTLPCPVCRDTDSYQWEERGLTTGITRTRYGGCRCGNMKLIAALVPSCIPQHDLFVQLATLQSSDKSQLPSEKQTAVLAELRTNPDGSYAFFGPAGCSKTTFCVALYRRRLVNWASNHPVRRFESDKWGGDTLVAAKRACPIWRVSAKALLEDFVKESMHETHDGTATGGRIRPAVNRKDIARYGKEGALFIEEIDKVKYTEYKVNALFEVIDACYENGTQLVFNTNLTPEKFAALFGPEVGPAIARRVVEHCEVYNFFEG